METLGAVFRGLGAVLEAKKGSAEAQAGSTGAQAGPAGQANLAPKKIEKSRKSGKIRSTLAKHL